MLRAPLPSELRSFEQSEGHTELQALYEGLRQRVFELERELSRCDNTEKSLERQKTIEAATSILPFLTLGIAQAPNFAVLMLIAAALRKIVFLVKNTEAGMDNLHVSLKVHTDLNNARRSLGELLQEYPRLSESRNQAS